MTGKMTKRAFPVAGRSVAIALAVAAACTGCSFGLGGPAASTPSASVATTPSAGAAAATGGAATGKPASTLSPSPAATRSCPQRIYSSMTEAQRVGQLFLVGLPSDAATSQVVAAVDDYHFGSVLLAKSSASVATLAGGSAGIQALASKQATDGVRFLVAANQEGGEIQQLSGAGFSPMPSELVQGRSSLSAERTAAAQWGSELKAAGVNLDLAPVMDVVPQATASSNAPIGQLDREFGYDPVTNGTHGVAFIQGMAQAGVAATAKHFPGLGRVSGNTDFTSGVTDTVTTPDDPNLGSFKDAVSAGVPFVMIALALYTQIDPAHLAVFSPTVIQTMLRQRMGFSGVVMSDDLGQAAQVQNMSEGSRAVDFLNAGGDLITSQAIAPAESMATAVLADASSSASFRAEVAAADMKILAAKQALGLLPC
ncbi:MAG TPA: glycoside hydrolase family 3 N-terminal domain-containing protein [Trebonia sp.]|nr:glycoside hydrolase family 3 N-terminal domain-containing protein [Trebonia sp.]